MDESNDDRRNAATRQYRDWLIPATLFVGVDAGILLLAIQIDGRPKRLMAAGLLACSSIVLFILSLFWAVTRLESIEFLNRTPVEGGHMYVLSCLGVLTLLASLVVLAFVKSTLFGVLSGLIIVAGIIGLVFLLRYEDKLI